MILNGKSAGDDALRAAVGVLRDAGVQLEVRVTWEAGDAERLVAQAIADGIDTVIAAGGDGTLGVVAATLADRDEAATALPSLGLVPMGTANDFARAAGIPLAAEAALRLLRASPAHPIDLLRVRAEGNCHWVTNLASGGFGTEVTTQTGESLKSMLGGLAYVVSGLGQLGRMQPQHACLTGPDFRWEGEFIALGIGNGRQAGGGQVLCPTALVNDGLLDLTIVPPLEDGLLASLARAVSEGRQAALDEVAIRRQLPWVEISAPGPLTLNLDGEPLEASGFRIDCVPGRLRMHLPPDCPLRRNPATVGA